MLRDKFAVSALFGLLANIPKTILDTILYTAGFSRFFCWQVSGGVLLASRWLLTPEGYIIGAVIDLIFAGAFGVFIAYAVWIIREQGRLFFWKALGFSLAIWVLFCVIVERISMRPLLTDPRHVYYTFLVHQLWGAIFAFLLARYGRTALGAASPGKKA